MKVKRLFKNGIELSETERIMIREGDVIYASSGGNYCGPKPKVNTDTENKSKSMKLTHDTFGVLSKIIDKWESYEYPRLKFSVHEDRNKFHDDSHIGISLVEIGK
eukprot:UN30289